MKKSLFGKFRIIRHKVTPPVDPLVERLVNAKTIVALDPAPELKAGLFDQAGWAVSNTVLAGIDMIAIWVDYRELIVWMNAHPQSGFLGTTLLICPLPLEAAVQLGYDKLELPRNITAGEALAYLRPGVGRKSDAMQHYVNWTNFLREPNSKTFPLSDSGLGPAAGQYLASLPFHRQDPNERWG